MRSRYFSKFVPVLIFLLLVVSGRQARAQDELLIVKVTDFTRRASFELKNREEFRQLQRRIATEKRFHRKALDLAEKAWDADEDNGGKSFPSVAITARKASIVGRGYQNREEARDKLIYYQDKECRKRVIELRKTDKKYRKLRRMRGLLKRDTLEEESEDREREALCDRARMLYTKKLEELVPANASATIKLGETISPSAVQQ